MDLRKHILEAITLIAAALVCALVANAVASRERKMALVGTYPNALKVPVETSTAPLESVAAPVTPATTTATGTVATTVPAAITTKPTATAASGAITTTGSSPVAKAANPAAKPSTPQASPASPSPADGLKRFQPHPDRPYVEIGHADAAALHQAGALFLDARRTSIYEQGHIAGARPYSVWESDIDDKTRKLFDERSDPEQQALPIVVYCSGGECEDSHTLAQKLWGIQFNNVYVYKDGFPDWQKHNGPVRTGTAP